MRLAPRQRTRPRRVFLHIGLPKTGTTYLQDALWLNRDELDRRGLFLPGHRRLHLLAALDFCQQPSLAQRARKVEHPWSHLLEEIARQRNDALISHEFFAPAAPAEVAAGLADLTGSEVHVIVTARGLVDLVISRWQEWVKNGNRLGIDDYPKETPKAAKSEWGWPSIDLSIVLETWGSVVPPERLHLLPLARSAGGPDELLKRFLGVVELSPDGLTAPEAAVNQGLGIVEVELLRRINTRARGFDTPFARGHWIRGYLAEGRIRGHESERYRPSTDRLDTLLGREQRVIEQVRAGGFDVRGTVEDLVSADVRGRRHPSEVTDQEIAELAATVMAAMLSDVRDASEGREVSW